MAQAAGLRLPHVATEKRESRMLAVLRAVNARGPMTLAELVAEVHVSAATLRRDLAEMADQRLLVRTRGGAAPRAAHDEVPVHLRDLDAREAKHRIALRAAELIPPGPHVLALTGGTTTAEIAKALVRRHGLTVVTNALPIALELAAEPGSRVVLAGGTVRSTSLEAVGPLAEQAFRSVRIDTAVLGVDGVSAAGGATTHDEAEARTNAAMVERARRVVVVADGTKVGRATTALMVPAGRIDALVTDTTADRDELARLQAAGVTVHRVEPHR